MNSVSHRCSMKESMCAFLYKLMIHLTFGVILLLVIPMLISLCLMAIVWSMADPLLTKLEQGSHRHLER